ncbi:MAG TPA: 4-hydroxy-tetrahydrodipicolinate synthase [Candidatus Ratteibacteria bacterium]|nr:4-hydroxy-tetrahydrodipicolinate synthase [Candidatus Ratteibacteria bacterium]
MFYGSIVAIVTPIKNGQVDKESYKKLVEFHLENGTDGIVTCGCTGEPATLSMEEHKQLIKFTVDIVDKKIPVIAGTGSNNTKESLELTSFAKEVGCDGCLLITPYYNKPTQKGLYLHYKTIAESVDIPIILYNVPSRTGISISPETVAELSKIKNIVGIKEASGNFDQIYNIISLVDKDFVVLSGDDALTLPIIAVGGKGVVSVAANIVPKEVADMVKYALNGQMKKAREIHYKLYPIFKVLFIETNPIPVKTSLSLMRMIKDEWRLPLTPPSDENFQKIKETLKKYGVI